MTDNEIIKALECCIKGDVCENCPYFTRRQRYECGEHFNKDVLDLINCQKAEIERLHKEVDRLSQVVLYHDGEVADAIKEFAERFENELTKIEVIYFDEEHENFISANKVIALLVNLVKEMAGEK